MRSVLGHDDLLLAVIGEFWCVVSTFLWEGASWDGVPDRGPFQDGTVRVHVEFDGQNRQIDRDRTVERGSTKAKSVEFLRFFVSSLLEELQLFGGENTHTHTVFFFS